MIDEPNPPSFLCISKFFSRFSFLVGIFCYPQLSTASIFLAIKWETTATFWWLIQNQSTWAMLSHQPSPNKGFTKKTHQNKPRDLTQSSAPSHLLWHPKSVVRAGSPPASQLQTVTTTEIPNNNSPLFTKERVIAYFHLFSPSTRAVASQRQRSTTIFSCASSHNVEICVCIFAVKKVYLRDIWATHNNS